MPKLHRISHTKIVSVILGAAVTAAASEAAASHITFHSWDAASEFSDSSNPSDNGAGPFSYGYETTLNNGTFLLLTHADNAAPPIKGWQRTNNLTKGPFITHNKTNVTKGPFGNAFVIYQPHGLSLHPGRQCQYADLRFTAPQSGNYRISGQFYAMDYNAGTTTDVAVSVNGGQVFGGQIKFLGGPANASFTPSNLVAALQPNDTIDFQVGCGANGDYFSDSTGLDAVIEQE